MNYSIVNRMAEHQDILTANLAALRVTEPELADRIENAKPRSLEWVSSRAGPLTASVEHNGRPLWLASKYDPLAEADKLISVVDYSKHACIVTLGLGLVVPRRANRSANGECRKPGSRL